MHYQLYVAQPELVAEAITLAEFTKSINIVEDLSQVVKSDPYLVLNKDGLAVKVPGLKPMFVHEVYAKLSFRIRDWHKDLLVDAIKSKSKLTGMNILDITAGLAKDAALLAFAGCKVTMLERHPVLATIIYYALQHGYLPSTNLELIFADSVSYLSNYPLNKPNPDVIYFDPMFNDGNTKALAKQDMQLIQLLNLDETVDNNIGNRELFLIAHKLSPKVVVKRDNKQSPVIDSPKTSYTKLGKTVRFDVYTTRHLAWGN